MPFKDVLLAAHLKVLSLVSGQREVTTGYEHSGRPELPGAQASLGLHLNSVPLRLRLGADRRQRPGRPAGPAEAADTGGADGPTGSPGPS